MKSLGSAGRRSAHGVMESREPLSSPTTDTEFAMYREAQRLLTGVNAGLSARGESASFRVTVANDGPVIGRTARCSFSSASRRMVLPSRPR